MAKWYVTIIYDAAKTIEVDAVSEEDARRKAIETAPRIHLCHQCSGDIDIGDAIEVVDAITE